MSSAASAPARLAGGESNVKGLNSIRFWCAIWVYFSHFGFVPLPHQWHLPTVVIGVYHNLFCGVAAVIGFFVISGFCIHYPYATQQRLPIAEFYVRRYVRLLPPLAAALLLGKLLSENIVGFYQAIIWSLIAELIYYTIYPLLRLPLLRWPWETVLLSYAVSFILIAAFPGALNFHEFGPGLTWLVGLPSWLLGCRLATSAIAEGSRAGEGPSLVARSPWFWRATVWGASAVASMLRFHAHIGYPFTLTLFGILVFFWIRAEIRHFRAMRPPRYAEFCGRWSYSFYLLHGLAALEFASFGLPLSPIPLWILQTFSALIASFSFYLVIEAPAHRLARSLGRLARRRSSDDV